MNNTNNVLPITKEVVFADCHYHEEKRVGVDTEDNLQQLSCGLWVVRTQAGYRKLLKKRWADANDRSVPTNHPKAYPAVVRLFYRGQWGDTLCCEWQTLNQYKEKLQHQLQEIEGM